MANKWGKTPSEFAALPVEDRVRMNAWVIANGWIESVFGDID